MKIMTKINYDNFAISGIKLAQYSHAFYRIRLFNLKRQIKRSQNFASVKIAICYVSSFDYDPYKLCFSYLNIDFAADLNDAEENTLKH